MLFITTCSNREHRISQRHSVYQSQWTQTKTLVTQRSKTLDMDLDLMDLATSLLYTHIKANKKLQICLKKFSGAEFANFAKNSQSQD